MAKSVRDFNLSVNLFTDLYPQVCSCVTVYVCKTKCSSMYENIIQPQMKIYYTFPY